MSIIIPANTLAAAGGFNVENSCMFDYASGDNVHKTPGSAGSGTKFVFSTWIKRTKLATAMNIIYAQTATNNYERIRFVGTDKIEISGVASGSTAYNFATDALYRDPAAWMHLHVIRDSTQGTASNRLKVYVNGVLQALTQDTALSQNYSGLITGANVHRIAIGNGEPLGAYLAEVILLDGQVITPDGNTGEFDEDSGIWKPLDVSGLTFGTTGFHLDFQASGNLGNDANGGDDFTEVNLAATNQSTDTCTNNFATMNPLDNFYYNGVFSEGNLKIINGSGREAGATSTIALSSGKWFWEATPKSNVAPVIGIASTPSATNTSSSAAISVNGFGYLKTGKVETSNGSGGSTVLASYATYAADDIIGVALDLDSSQAKIYFYKNGALQGSGVNITSASATTNGHYFVGFGVLGGQDTFEVNFGSPPYANSSSAADGNGFGDFEYAPPSGYFSLNTKNLAEYG